VPCADLTSFALKKFLVMFFILWVLWFRRIQRSLHPPIQEDSKDSSSSDSGGSKGFFILWFMRIQMVKNFRMKFFGCLITVQFRWNFILHFDFNKISLQDLQDPSKMLPKVSSQPTPSGTTRWLMPHRRNFCQWWIPIGTTPLLCGKPMWYLLGFVIFVIGCMALTT